VVLPRGLEHAHLDRDQRPVGPPQLDPGRFPGDQWEAERTAEQVGGIPPEQVGGGGVGELKDTVAVHDDHAVGVFFH
jgi:hypothetical protein